MASLAQPNITKPNPQIGALIYIQTLDISVSKHQALFYPNTRLISVPSLGFTMKIEAELNGPIVAEQEQGLLVIRAEDNNVCHKLSRFEAVTWLIRPLINSLGVFPILKIHLLNQNIHSLLKITSIAQKFCGSKCFRTTLGDIFACELNQFTASLPVSSDISALTSNINKITAAVELSLSKSLSDIQQAICHNQLAVYKSLLNDDAYTDLAALNKLLPLPQDLLAETSSTTKIRRGTSVYLIICPTITFDVLPTKPGVCLDLLPIQGFNDTQLFLDPITQEVFGESLEVDCGGKYPFTFISSENVKFCHNVTSGHFYQCSGGLDIRSQNPLYVPTSLNYSHVPLTAQDQVLVSRHKLKLSSQKYIIRDMVNNIIQLTQDTEQCVNSTTCGMLTQTKSLGFFQSIAYFFRVTIGNFFLVNPIGITILTLFSFIIVLVAIWYLGFLAQVLSFTGSLLKCCISCLNPSRAMRYRSRKLERRLTNQVTQRTDELRSGIDDVTTKLNDIRAEFALREIRGDDPPNSHTLNSLLDPSKFTGIMRSFSRPQSPILRRNKEVQFSQQGVQSSSNSRAQSPSRNDIEKLTPPKARRHAPAAPTPQVDESVTRAEIQPLILHPPDLEEA